MVDFYFKCDVAHSFARKFQCAPDLLPPKTCAVHCCCCANTVSCALSVSRLCNRGNCPPSFPFWNLVQRVVEDLERPVI